MFSKFKLIAAIAILATFSLLSAGGCKSGTTEGDIPPETKAAPLNPDAEAGPAPVNPDLVPGPKKPGMGGPPPNATGG